MSEANLSIIKITAYHCWMCGGLFDEENIKKTMHHAIPRFLKPKRNVEIPICENCHKQINSYNIQNIKTKDGDLNKTIEQLKGAISSFSKAMKKTKDSIDDLENLKEKAKKREVLV